MTENTNLPLTARKLISFRSLPAGWHYGRGGPITAVMMSRAINMYHSLMLAGFTKTDAFPGVDGEVQLTGYHFEHFVSITAELDNSYTVVHEIAGSECCEAGRITWLEAKAMLRKIVGEVWNTSASSIQSTGTLSVKSSATWHSKSPATAGSLWSARPAPKQLVAA